MSLVIISIILIFIFVAAIIIVRHRKRYRRKIAMLESENMTLSRNYARFCPISKNKRAYLLNDTRRETNHCGCELVNRNIEICLEKNGIDVSFSDSTNPNCDITDKNAFVSILSHMDILILNGEGTLHDDAGTRLFEKCLLAKELGIPCVLINSVWQNNRINKKYLHIFDIIAVRESLSLQELPPEYRHKALCVPDLTMLSNADLKYSHAEKPCTVLTDSVIRKVSKKLEKYAKRHKYKFWTMNPRNGNIFVTEEKIASLSRDSMVITGRFHVATLCIKYGIPFLAIESNTHKISGLLKDSNLDFCLINSVDEIDNAIARFDKDKFHKNASIYTSNANSKIDSLFSGIRRLIIEGVN